jgi:hypothetical protein
LECVPEPDTCDPVPTACEREYALGTVAPCTGDGECHACATAFGLCRTAWQITRLQSLSEESEQARIQVDGSGQPHLVAHGSRSNGDRRWIGLHYASPGPLWDRRVIDFAGVDPALAVDLDGVPHVSFGRGSGSTTTLAHATWTWAGFDPNRRSWRGDWEITDLAPAGGLESSIALLSRTSPRIAAYAPGRGDLEFSFFGNPLWTTTPVDVTGDTGRFPALALRGDSAPAIAYWDSSNKRIKLAVLSAASGWTVHPHNLQANSGPGSGFVGLARTSNGTDYVTYQLDYPGSLQLRLATFDGTDWHSDGFVTGSLGGGGFASLGLVEPDELPAMAFVDASGTRVLANLPGQGATVPVVVAGTDPV